MSYPPDSTGSPGYGYPGNYPNYGQGSTSGPQHSATQPAHWRGRRPIQVGIILLVVGLALAITGGALANAKSLSKVNGFQRVAVSAGSGTVNFSHAGGYVAYYESKSVSSSTRQVPLIPGVLTNASGATVQLTTKYGNRSDGKIKALHYDYKGHHGLAMWQFHIDQPGAWRVQFATNDAPDADAVVAFGPSIATGVVIGGILVVVGILMLLGGLVTLIVGLVKRRRHKNEVRASGFGRVAPVGGSSWPQQAGGTEWPQPGGATTWPPPSGGGTAWPQPGGTTNWPPPEGSGPAWPQPGGGTAWPPPSSGSGTEWPPPGGGTAWPPPPPPERGPNG